jgi:hypothetical protein
MLDGRCDGDPTRARAGDELAFAYLRSRLMLQPG